jgi:O-succinylhomoserine sulfhydrylase
MTDVITATGLVKRYGDVTALAGLDLAVPEGTGPDAAKKHTFAFLDALRIVDISNNLGDAKSLVTHPATTTHRKLGPTGRAAVGITETTVRLSVGLEDPLDIIEDVEQALANG